jgi:hypothetical protein
MDILRNFSLDCMVDVPYMSRWPVPGPSVSFGILGPPRCEGFDDDDVVAPNVKHSQALAWPWDLEVPNHIPR